MNNTMSGDSTPQTVEVPGLIPEAITKPFEDIHTAYTRFASADWGGILLVVIGGLLVILALGWIAAEQGGQEMVKRTESILPVLEKVVK